MKLFKNFLTITMYGFEDFISVGTGIKLSWPIILPVFFLHFLMLAVKQIVLESPFIHIKHWPIGTLESRLVTSQGTRPATNHRKNNRQRK